MIFSWRVDFQPAEVNPVAVEKSFSREIAFG
jgi:hypothetical protein